MPNPALLTPDAVDIPESQLYEAEVLDNATKARQEVRCIVPGFAEHLATDPMPWNPVPEAAGLFYPKKEDRAVVAIPTGGAPVILEWWPSSETPDVPS